MDTWWREALWAQFGAAIDTLEAAVVACPDALWHEQLWIVPAEESLSPDFAAVWYVTYHTLFWLDLYLTGTDAGFAPPEPFTLAELDPAGVLPERPYTKDELRAYIAHTRGKCQRIIGEMTDERARRTITFPWTKGKPFSFFELQLYNMRHVQEHAAQLHLLLGQHAIHVDSEWVARARDEAGGGKS